MAPRMFGMLYFFATIGINLVASNVLSRNCSIVPCISPSKSLSETQSQMPSASYAFQIFASAIKNSSSGNETKHVAPEKHHKKVYEGIKVAKWDFKRVQTPFVVCIWILLASVAKIGMKNAYLFFAVPFKHAASVEG